MIFEAAAKIPNLQHPLCTNPQYFSLIHRREIDVLMNSDVDVVVFLIQMSMHSMHSPSTGWGLVPVPCGLQEFPHQECQDSIFCDWYGWDYDDWDDVKWWLQDQPAKNEKITSSIMD